MNDLGIYSDYLKEYDMQRAYNPKYIIYVMAPNGPDDFDWIEHDEVDTLTEATALLMSMDNAGHKVKMFDPYCGQEFLPNEID